MSKSKPFTKNDPRINKTGRKKTYPQEVIDFISDNSGAMSDKELSAAINRCFNLNTTRQSINSLRRYYRNYRIVKKWKKTSQEVLDFIRANSGDMSDRELSENINRQFNLSMSRMGIRSLRHYHKIYKGGRRKQHTSPFRARLLIMTFTLLENGEALEI